MSETIRVIQVGIGGFGGFLLEHLLEPPPGIEFDLVGLVDPAPRDVRGLLPAVERRGIPVYPNLDECLAKHEPHLAVLASPIQFHATQSRQLLERGVNVLCEKPVGATVQEGLTMVEAEAASDAFCAIGYQWSYSESIQRLKADILAGRWGRPLRMRTLIFWPRPLSYYQRNNWAGKRTDEGGRMVLDSPVANATAHFLHNCLYVLGDTRERSAQPTRLQAETYRINDIETFDTAALRVEAADTEILFYTSHATGTHVGPIFAYDFEEGTVHHRAGNTGWALTGLRKNGETVDYGDPQRDVVAKLWQALDACRGGAPMACPVAAAMPHLICANATMESCVTATVIPEAWVEEKEFKGSLLRYVEGLEAIWFQAYALGRLPSAMGGVPWAKAGRELELTNYRRFPSFA